VPRVGQVMKQTRARIFRGDTRTEGKMFNPRERPTAKILQSEPADPVGAFTQLADQIQRRDHCPRVTALQRAVDENRCAFEAYCRAFGDHRSLSGER
jgi:hypothetical protein